MALWGKNDDKSSTGTVAIAANGLVTGSSTLFQTEARIGDILKVTDTGAEHVITSITSNTVAQVQSGINGATISVVDAGNNYTLSEKPSYVGLAESQAAFAGNTAQVFGVSTGEAGVPSGNVVQGIVVSGGSGYGANATVTFSGGGGAGATANAEVAVGRVTTINITAGGEGYETSPSITISAPAGITFNALSAVSNTNDTIALTTANSKFLVGDQVTYTVAAGNTAVGGLANGTTYFVVAANTTTIKLGATSGGPAINLTASVSETGHTLTGTTATGAVVISGGVPKGTTAGWVRRIVGTGGRAGRVQYESLVAMRNITGDAADDSVLPDYAIVIGTQPTAASGNSAANESVTFTVASSTTPSGGTITFLWQYTTDPGNTETWATTAAVTGLSGQTSNTLTVNTASFASGSGDGTLFRVVLSATGAPSVTSDSAELTVS